MKKILVIGAILITFFWSCSITGDEKTGSRRGFNPLKSIVQVYQGPLDHLSAVRQGECPMYPSCSEYSRQALEKYGFFMGAMIAADRLLRCGRDEMKSAPLIFVDGKWKYYDPLEENTSWWAGSGDARSCIPILETDATCKPPVN